MMKNAIEFTLNYIGLFENGVEHFIEKIINLPEAAKDTITFLSVVFLGAFYKVRKEQKNGITKKVTITWFLAEALMSLFIALIVLAVLDHLLSLPKLLTLMLCALLGSMSTTVHDKTEDLIVYALNSVKTLIDKYFKTVGNENNKNIK